MMSALWEVLCGSAAWLFVFGLVAVLGHFTGPGTEGETMTDYDTLEAHERQDAQFDVEAGEAAYMLTCGHALPRWSSERLRQTPERWCGICQAWSEKA